MTKVLTLLCTLVVLGACAGTDEGGAEVGIAVDALTAADIHDVRLTITGPGMSPIVTSLVNVGGAWQGTIDQIPAGANRTFLGEARDSSGTVVYSGTASGIPIVAHQTALVHLLLEELDPPPPFTNVAPRITVVYVSSSSVAPEELVQMRVEASDANGDPITYTWQASGTLTANGPSATWRAASNDGTYYIAATASDSHGASDQVAIAIEVAAANARGAAGISVTVNSAPRVDNVSSSLVGRLTFGQATTLAVAASDPDGDVLGYAWTATCGGTFSNASASPTTFTRDVDDGATSCVFTATVSDGHGGSNTGTLELAVDPAPTPYVAPVIDSTFESAGSANDGDVITLRVQAHDPHASALTIAWTSDQGALGAATTTGGDSELTWTAPLCFTSPATITVAVTNAYQQTTTATLAIAAARSTCLPAGLVARWDGQSMTDVIGGRTLVADGPGMTIDPRGVTGTSYGFNGNGDGATAPDTGLPAGAADRTLEMWALIDVAFDQSYLGGWGQAGSFGQAFFLGAFGTNVPFATNWGQGIGGGHLDATWHHVAATVASGTISLYVDGVLVSTTGMTWNTSLGGGFHLGAIAIDAAHRTHGAIDEVRVYNRALSAAEIASLAAMPSAH